MKTARTILLGLTVLAASSHLHPSRGGDDQVGVSQEDLPRLNSMFSIENPTGAPIHYKIRWGNHAWKRFVVDPRTTREHWYPLHEGRAPAPYIEFDSILNDGAYTRKGYHMRFYPVGYGGYGPNADAYRTPKRYYFKVSSDGRFLDLLAR